MLSMPMSKYSGGSLQESSKEILFLKSLYFKKTQELKSIKNQRHERIFIERLKGKVNESEFIAVECDLGKGCIK